MTRVLWVSRTRYRLPLEGPVDRKWDSLARVVDLRVLATGANGAQRNEQFTLVRARTPAFYLALPWHVARELRSFKPGVVIAQSPYEAAAVLAGRTLARSRAKIVVEVHGDWRTASRLYGSPWRRLSSSLADAAATTALRRVDAVRAVSAYTSGLVREIGVEPSAEFPAYMELDPFLVNPTVEPPLEPRAVFVGVLERYKNVDGLAAVWPDVVARVPNATLHIVGRGSLESVIRNLVYEYPSVTWTEHVGAEGVAAALDAASFLVLPSRSEGMGRVIIEAFCRARPVVGARVGGITGLIEDGVNGLLVDTGELASAMERLLLDRELARALGAAAHAGVGSVLQTPEEYAEQIRALVDGLAA